MRIVFLHNRLRSDGATRVMVSLGNMLVDSGHSVYCVTIGNKENLIFPIHFPLIEIATPLRNTYFNALFSIFSMPQSLPECDFVIGSSVPITFAVFIASVRRKVRGINFIQGDDVGIFDDGSLIKSEAIRALYRLITLLSYRLPLKVITNSEWTSGQYHHYASRQVLGIVNPAVDLKVFKPGRRIPGKLPVLVVVGRKHLSKGLDDVFTALNQLGVSFKLTVISHDSLNISPKPYPVEIRRPTSDNELAEIYRSADVFVHASWREGFGMPPLEAMACSAPVALTDSGGVHEFAVHGYNCLMSAPQQPMALAKNIRSLLYDIELRDRLSANGIKTAQQFTWERSAEKFEQILMQITAR